jgi:hypothetical protein
MKYYCFVDDVCVLKTNNISNAIGFCLADTRDMSKNNAKVIDMVLYDSSVSVEYWKLAKIREIETYIYNQTKDGFLTTSGVRVDISEAALTKQALAKVMNDNANDLKALKNIDFVDFNGDTITITVANYKTLLKEIEVFAMPLWRKLNRTKELIRKANTISEVQAIEV